MASDSARTILVAGTASHVGKSTVAAGLCRVLADRGVSVAPYKAQNMSNNARAVPRPTDDGAAYGEIGVSQYVQARAARVPPTTDMNPVLLKPRGDGESQLVIDGVGVDHFEAGSYYENGWTDAREAAIAAHARLADRHDVIVAEGAGSIAEINLHHRDLANVETARFADADILLVADIERGGVFASLVGTLELMPADLRDRVCGALITKFRGDTSLLNPGLDAFEERTGVPVLGVLPYDDPGLPEEDSVSLPAAGDRAIVGDDDGIPPEQTVTIAVPRFPRASNVTDLEPLAAVPGVRVAYVPLSADLKAADAIVLPGTKNTANDLLALVESGLADRIRQFEGPIVGICGGYQMLGERLENVSTEATTETTIDDETVTGIGLLPVRTVFSAEKRVRPIELSVDGSGPISGVTGVASGYEIHTGETTLVDEAGYEVTPETLPFVREGTRSAALGYCRGQVLGTYLHGLFENETIREAFVDAVYESAGRSRPDSSHTTSESVDEAVDDPYAAAAALIREHVDPDSIGVGDMLRSPTR